MHPRVKICGLTRLLDVEWAVACGADAIGLVLAPSPRQVDKRTARRLLQAVGPDVIKVAVFRSVSPSDVEGLADLGFDAVQGESLTAIPGPLELLPVVIDGPHLRSRVDRVLRHRNPAAPGSLSRLGNPDILLDGPLGGGGGAPAETRRATNLARRHRIVLAGGLTPENVGRSVEAVGPVAVDVGSGVESAPGRKDPQRVKAFIEAAQAAATTTEALS